MVEGDKLTLGGVQCTVIEVQHATDALGQVSFTESNISLTIELSAGVPLAEVNDPTLAAFVLKTTNGSNYAVGVYHPWFGMKIAPSPPSAKPIAEIITTCWLFPEVTISHDGVAQEGANVTLLALRTSESDGLVAHLHGADRFVDTISGKTGEWETNASGVVKHQHGDGCPLADIYLPCGEGAMFQRSGDLRDSQAAAPDEYLSELGCYYRGAHVVIEEGTPASIDLEAGTIHVTGDPGCNVYAWLYDIGLGAPDLGVMAGTVVLDGGGAGDITGLADGHYILAQRTAGITDFSSICQRQEIDLADGATVNVAMGSMETPAAGDSIAYIYHYGATLADVTVYEYGPSANVLPTVYGTGGRVEWTGDGTAMVQGHDTWRAVIPDTGPCWELVLYGRLLMVSRDPTVPFSGPAAVWWNAALPHRDFTLLWPQVHAEEEDGDVPDLAFYEMSCGLYSDITTEWLGEATWGAEAPGSYAWVSITQIYLTWDIVDAAGNVLIDGAAVTPASDATVGHYGGTGGVQWKYGHSTASTAYVHPLIGGKLSGNVVAGEGDVIDVDWWPEAVRMGLEFGEWQPETEVRLITDALAGSDEIGAVGARIMNVCPYCLGPVHKPPSDVDHSMGYCMQCASDARTYMRTPTVSEAVYDVRVRKRLPWGFTTEYLLAKWTRPVNYLENDDFLYDNWKVLGYDRWVAQHVTMGIWGAGTLTPGDDTDDIKAANNLTTDVYVQPKVIPGSIEVEATYTIGFTMADSSTEYFEITLYPGEEDPRPLTRVTKLGPATGEETLTAADFVKSLHSIVVDDPGDSDANYFSVVADNPAIVDQMTPIENQEQTPWVCQLIEPIRQYLWYNMFGLLHQLRSHAGQIDLRWMPYPTISWLGLQSIEEGGANDLFIGGRYGQGWCVMSWRRGWVVSIARSFDQGETIDGPYGLEMDYSQVRHALCGGLWYTAGRIPGPGDPLPGTGVWYIRKRRVDDTEFEWLPFPNGFTEIGALTIDEDADVNYAECVFESDPQGNLYLIFDGAVYLSQDSGFTWSLMATFEPLGWSDIRGWLVGNHLMLVGRDGSNWKAATAIVYPRELVWTTMEGDIEHQIAADVGGDIGLEVDSVSNAVALVYRGEHWVYRSYDYGARWERVI